MTKPASKVASAPCHNCRKKRWKCDRGLPSCYKCTDRGQHCQGYGRHLRWDQGMASRGKLKGRTTLAASRSSPESASPSSTSSPETSCSTSLASSPRQAAESLAVGTCADNGPYLDYFSDKVCKELVLHDDSISNPYRQLVPMADQYQALFHIMVAMAALHMSNATKQTSPSGRIPGLQKPLAVHMHQSPTTSGRELYRVALSAKQKALFSLKLLLDSRNTNDADAALAAVLLFIEFDLLDSGRSDWMYHVKGAQTVITDLCRTSSSTLSKIGPLRRSLISNYLIYEIIGSTFSCSINERLHDLASSGTICLLQDTEGVHCSGFPLELLMILRKAAFVLSKVSDSKNSRNEAFHHEAELLELLQATRSFDALLWSTKVRKPSSDDDVLGRTYVALAHRAAVSIYISRILLVIYPNENVPYNIDSLLREIISNVFQIPREGPHFTAIAWPMFVAGAETGNIENQRWVAGIFEDLWQVQPWGLIRGAFGVLESIWNRQAKRQRNNDADTADTTKITTTCDTGDNWVLDLRNSGVDWLII